MTKYYLVISLFKKKKKHLSNTVEFPQCKQLLTNGTHEQFLDKKPEENETKQNTSHFKAKCNNELLRFPHSAALKWTKGLSANIDVRMYERSSTQ